VEASDVTCCNNTLSDLNPDALCGSQPQQSSSLTGKVLATLQPQPTLWSSGQTKTVLYLAVNQQKESSMGFLVFLGLMYVLVSIEAVFRK
jgi:hypothetical protein